MAEHGEGSPYDSVPLLSAPSARYAPQLPLATALALGCPFYCSGDRHACWFEDYGRRIAAQRRAEATVSAEPGRTCTRRVAQRRPVSPFRTKSANESADCVQKSVRRRERLTGSTVSRQQSSPRTRYRCHHVVGGCDAVGVRFSGRTSHH